MAIADLNSFELRNLYLFCSTVYLRENRTCDPLSSYRSPSTPKDAAAAPDDDGLGLEAETSEAVMTAATDNKRTCRRRILLSNRGKKRARGKCVPNLKLEGEAALKGILSVVVLPFHAHRQTSIFKVLSPNATSVSAALRAKYAKRQQQRSLPADSLFTSSPQFSMPSISSPLFLGYSQIGV